MSAVEQYWSVAPFAAVMDGSGRITARGAQDMKCVCIMYLEALRRLIRSGVQSARTIHLSFMPDEELGGGGMKSFIEAGMVKTNNHKKI